MKCPVDNSVLQMTERQGVEIDYCPTCRGVWLDRGELDKIIERGDAPRPTESYREAPREHRSDSAHYGYDSHKKRRKEGMLGDLFDF